jgi:hypothetical protein
MAAALEPSSATRTTGILFAAYAGTPTSNSARFPCNGVFPCAGIDYGNQQGDYSGLVSFGGVSHPIWTDSRKNLVPSAGCRGNLTMEEVFTATVK